MLDSSTGLQQVIRTFMGGGTTNIFNMFNQQNNVDQHTENNTISLEDARQLILDSNVVYNDKSKEARLLETRYDLGALPEVVATKQEGMDGSEGASFNINQAEIKEVIEDYKGSYESASREHHEMRREIEQNIDPYEEDPEAYIELNSDQYKEPEPDSFASTFLNK